MDSNSRKNNSGFMLVEVLITIAIVGMTLVPIFMTQANALRGLYRYSQRLRLIAPAKNFMVDIFAGKIEKSEKEEAEASVEKKEIKNPKAELTHKKSKISDGSALKKIKDLQAHEVIVRGSRGGRESIVGFVYAPKRKKKKDETGVHTS